ncbi:MAG: hypothetical protein JWO82_3436 [Akkermansiaceae bacterium]|nr:hypothetical protein [Akkermansiaceae bacterium]
MKIPTLLISLLALSGSLRADVTIADAWVRATVPAQKATGAFMKLTSKGDVKLVSATCDITKTVEIHEMSMDGEKMKMREVKAIDLPDGKTVSLKPGGYHVMLLDLPEQVKPGQEITFKLVFEKADGSRETQEVKAKAYPVNETPFTDKAAKEEDAKH